MSGPLYPNQPLIEVAAEVRFQGDLAIEQIRPEFQTKIRDPYSQLLVPGAQEGIAPSLQPIRFEREDRLSGFQLAVNSFSHFSRSYPGNETFMGEVENGIALLLELVESVEVTRIGWRYINAIPFTRENRSLPLDRFFQENRYFGNSLQCNLYGLNYRALLPINDRQINIHLESAESSVNPGEETLLLDIDVFELKDPTVSTLEFSIVKNIREVHEEAYGVFESLITDTYRAFLKGGSDE